MTNQFIVGGAQKLKIFLLLTKFTKIVKYLLEQNYRSTKYFRYCSHLISNNTNRVGKKLWSSATQGELVKLNIIEMVKRKRKVLVTL